MCPIALYTVGQKQQKSVSFTYGVKLSTKSLIQLNKFLQLFEN